MEKVIKSVFLLKIGVFGRFFEFIGAVARVLNAYQIALSLRLGGEIQGFEFSFCHYFWCFLIRFGGGIYTLVTAFKFQLALARQKVCFFRANPAFKTLQIH